ncbi:MAG: cytochrome B [Rhodobacterales bacterium 12-65-15]|nr:MAG: cytochrome B [Rhodobacterales bacterium 12-65-15]
MADPWTSERQAGIAPPDLWDPLVRISHWGIAFIVVMNALLTKGGSPLHLWLGWIGMALLLLRLVWGVLGPVEARFSAFPPSPRAALSHLRGLVSGRAPQYRSHNPAGALMVYAFWVTLAVVIGTGLLRTGGQTPMQAARDAAAVASGDWSVLVTETDGGGESRFGTLPGEVHTVAANLLLILAALHVAGVAVESRAMRRNLVAPMLTGSKRRRG